jgi:phytoene dehydrogenase-like protein
MSSFDVAVVGSGPNGLAAAVEAARSGRSVVLVEQASIIGGGTRTEELTEPGFLHDVCSSVHPTGVASPFFNRIGLDVEWIQPEIPFSHPLGDGRAVALFSDLDETAGQLGEDSGRYRKLMEPLARSIDDVVETLLGPMMAFPKRKVAFAQLAMTGALPMAVLAARFRSEQAKALLAGVAAHSIAPLTQPATAGVGLFLGVLAHTHGWPVAKGGSSQIANALAAELEANGGVVELDHLVTSVDELDADAVIFDTMPDAVLRIARDRLEPSVIRRLERWKPGSGVFKVDWALEGPIPWADDLSPRAATVHVGGLYGDIAAAEKEASRGVHSELPFVLVTQPSIVDLSRAPTGKHTAWGYCHVPAGSTVDMTEAIENQMERFAPGFKDVVRARFTRTAAGYESHNPNYVGGDIGGGRFGIRKLLQVGDAKPFTLGNGIYIGSSAVPPGAGVHGMCGSLAAKALIAAG